jgi:hypothetical protein
MFINLGKLLILLGGIIFILGIFLLFVGKVPFLGKLPGDIHIHKKNFDLYFPLTTCILISIVLSLIFIFFGIFKK